MYAFLFSSPLSFFFSQIIVFRPTDFTDLHRFSSSEDFSSDFTDESEGILAYRITHGFSRIFGLWPMAGARYMLLLFFCHADFADDADFSSWEGFVPQISQIITDFYSYFYSSDFTDESEGILACRITHGFSRNFGRWPMARALYMLLLFLSRRFRR